MPKRNHLTFIGRTTFRNQRRLFGIQQADRRQHLYVIGQTGTGKSTLLEALMRQDLVNGAGFALVDPHGDLAERVVSRCPPGRRSELTYWNVPDPSVTVTFNPLAASLPATRLLAASGALEVFKKLWLDSWGPRLEHLLRYALLALVDIPGATLADLLRLLEDDEFRRDAAQKVGNPLHESFFVSLKLHPHRTARRRRRHGSRQLSESLTAGHAVAFGPLVARSSLNCSAIRKSLLPLLTSQTRLPACWTTHCGFSRDQRHGREQEHSMKRQFVIALVAVGLTATSAGLAFGQDTTGSTPGDLFGSELLKRLAALEQEVKEARAEAGRAREEIQRLQSVVSAEGSASPRIVPAMFVDDGAAPGPNADAHVRSALERPLSEEGIRAFIASMGKVDLSSRVDALEERLNNDAAAAAAAAQAPVDSSQSALSIESPFGVKIRLTGQIKTEGIVSSRNLGFFQGDLALAAPPRAGINPLNGFPNNQRLTNIDFRESRIGLAMAGPAVRGAETSAYFAIDGYTFGSGVPGGLSSFSVPKNPVSFLFAYADIKWPNLQLHIGQDLTPYGNYFTETINFLQGGGRGSFFGFSPQVRGTYNVLSAFSDSPSQRLELIGAVARSTSGLFGLEGPVGQGELSAQPQYHAGVRYANNRWGNVPLHIAGYNMAAPFEVEVMGMYARNNFGRLRGDLLGAKEFRTFGVEVAATVPIIPARTDGPRRSLSFRGSGYTGENLQQGFQTGAAGIVINKRTGLADEAAGEGFMGQVKYYFTNNLAWVNAYGLDDTDRHAGVLNGFPFSGGLRMTRTYFTTLFYQFPAASNILLAVQYNNYRDDYQNGDRGDLNFYQAALYYRF